jgi:hypothetical protein
MENFFCGELDSLTRRLKCAIERKNELIAANLFGRWMMAAEADLTRTNELLMNHHRACPVCGAHLEALLSRSTIRKFRKSILDSLHSTSDFWEVLSARLVPKPAKR